VALTCGGSTESKDASSDANEDNISVAAYGIAVEAGPMKDAGWDAPIAAYGGPPSDGGDGG
jgi:hypothetical protein